MSNQFFTELTRVLNQKDIKTAEPESGYLPILLEGQPAIRVEPSGMLLINANYARSEDASALHEKVAPFSEMVHEYVSLMERAPLLQSDSGNDTYRLLADFNGVILAGKEKGRYGYQFATWRHDASGTGFEQGHYFPDQYAAAKEDFACRAGLVEKGRQFSDEQLVEMSRCVKDTLDGDYELTEAQETLLEAVHEQIENVVPNYHRLLAESMEAYVKSQSQEQKM